MTVWQPVYVGLGSNLHQPAQQLSRALQALQQLPLTRLICASSFYQSEPMGPVPQPDYLNAVAGLLTQQPMAEFFRALRALEVALGREPPRQRWGPRSIDLDLLVFGSQRADQADLTVPHPGIVQRNFVLYPLRELAPDLTVPGLGRVAELAAKVDASGIRPLQHTAS